MSKPEYTCPSCGNHDFELAVTQYIKVRFLPPDEDDHEVIDGPYGDMEWDDSDYARCICCYWRGHLSEAATP